MRDFVNQSERVAVDSAAYTELEDGNLSVKCNVTYGNLVREVTASGNGRLDCVSGAIKSVTDLDYTLESYTQHAIEGRTSARAASYVSIMSGGKLYWGCGIDSDIGVSSVKALISAVNKLAEKK